MPQLREEQTKVLFSLNQAWAMMEEYHCEAALLQDDEELEQAAVQVTVKMNFAVISKAFEALSLLEVALQGASH